MKPSELARRRYQHLCVFGDPKTGKSTMVADLIKSGYHLTWVSMDNGHEVIFKLLNQGVTGAELDERLDIIVIPDTKESPIAVRTCAAIVSGKPASICHQHGIVNCSACKSKGGVFSVVDTSLFTGKNILVFDHLGQLANSIMNLIMIKQKDEDKPEWEDYRVAGTLMDKFLTNVQQATYNVVCISHCAEIKMEDGGKKLVPVIGSDNFSRNSGKYFDHLVYVEVTGGKHRFGSSTVYKASVLTGSRSDIVIGADGSLVPFFDGTILPPDSLKLAGQETADKLLTTKAPEQLLASNEQPLANNKQEVKDNDDATRSGEANSGSSAQGTNAPANASGPGTEKSVKVPDAAVKLHEADKQVRSELGKLLPNSGAASNTTAGGVSTAPGGKPKSALDYLAELKAKRAAASGS